MYQVHARGSPTPPRDVMMLRMNMLGVGFEMFTLFSELAYLSGGESTEGVSLSCKPSHYGHGRDIVVR